MFVDHGAAFREAMMVLLRAATTSPVSTWCHYALHESHQAISCRTALRGEDGPPKIHCDTDRHLTGASIPTGHTLRCDGVMFA